MDRLKVKEKINYYYLKRKIRFLFFILIVTLQQYAFAWGWETHRYINEHAVEYLPPEMSFFGDHQDYIRSHATDPDSDNEPGYYHYIDIDYYPEFFEGTFPTNWDSATTQYGYDILIDYGTVPWVIEDWTDSLTNLMINEDWDNVWQIAAELGHYVADSHQPLHLTLNYNGQSTDNYGIHSRYETQMINEHLSELPLPDSTGLYWDSIIDSTFRYIYDIYPFVNDILIADDLASSESQNYNSTYYDILWEELDTMTINLIHKAIIDLSSVWKTAWINAGSPTLLIENNKSIPEAYLLEQNYPNPFNPQTKIRYFLHKDSFVNILINDLNGIQIKSYNRSFKSQGNHFVNWDSTDQNGESVSSGLYFYTFETDDFRTTKKMILLR